MTTNNNENIKMNGEMTLDELIQKQETTRKSRRRGNFTEYTSKKKLFESKILSDELNEMIKNLIGASVFNKHNELNYLIITMYDAKKEPKYSFFVLDIDTMKIVLKDSIKTAKEYVEDIASTVENKEEDKVEEKKEEVEKEEPKKKTTKKKEDKKEDKKVEPKKEEKKK